MSKKVQTEKKYLKLHEDTFKKIGELIYYYGKIEPFINKLLCEALDINVDINIIISVLNHVPLNKRIEIIEERVKAATNDGSQTDRLKEISKIVSKTKKIKSMRDVVSHCHWKVENNSVYFVQNNAMDYEKLVRSVNKNIQAIIDKLTKSKQYYDPSELERDIVEIMLENVSKKNLNDLNEALLLARGVMDFFIKEQKEKEHSAVNPS